MHVLQEVRRGSKFYLKNLTPVTSDTQSHITSVHWVAALLHKHICAHTLSDREVERKVKTGTQRVRDIVKNGARRRG